MADHEFSCVADSTDWLATGLKGLAAVEAALRCQVCKDFYNTPMMTTCAHTFCSLCIRRALASDGKCPLCRTSDQESKLRSNHALHEVVDAFTRCRADTMKFAEEPVPQPKLSPTQTLKRSAPEEQNHTPERKRLRRSARRIKPSNEPLTPDFQPDFPLDFDANVEEPSDDEYCEEPGKKRQCTAILLSRVYSANSCAESRQ
jgi:E3 ubiquitin-protein ligase RAD18